MIHHWFNVSQLLNKMGQQNWVNIINWEYHMIFIVLEDYSRIIPEDLSGKCLKIKIYDIIKLMRYGMHSIMDIFQTFYIVN